MSHQSLTPAAASSSSITGSKAKKNRKIVIVDQEIHKKEKRAPSLAISENSDAGEARLSAEYSRDSLTVKAPSGDIVPYSPDSSRSSNSSFFANEDNVEDVGVSSLEDRLFNELAAEIEATSAQFRQFQTDVNELFKLKERVEQLEIEKRIMAEDISAKDDIIEAMKQRLSVLHEQNNQLAQLTLASGGQSESLRMRNALVASLAQIKKLQVQVDEIPNLKAQISTLTDENRMTKQREGDILDRFSISLPEGTTPLDYVKLVEENAQLKSGKSDLSKDILEMVNRLQVVSTSMDELGNRVDDFEKSLSSDSHMATYISKLEKENEGLYCEIMKLKLNRSISCKEDVNNALLESECAMFQKNNSLLRSKLENMALKYKQQKEAIILKLFEIQLSGIKAEKWDIAKSLSDLDDVNGSSSSQHFLASNGNKVALLPQFESQVCKLHQIKLCSKQIKSALKMFTVEKDKTDGDSFLTHQDELVKDLKSQVKSFEANLLEAHSKIDQLENMISTSSQSSLFNVLKENSALAAQVGSLRDISKAFTTTQNKLLEEQRLHEAIVQKYKKVKDRKRALEAKLKDIGSKFQAVASELSGSATLLKNYQVECETLQKTADSLNAERETLKRDGSYLRAQLEVLKAEYKSTEHSLSTAEDVEQEPTTSGANHVAAGNITSDSVVQDARHRSEVNVMLLTEFRVLEEKAVELLDKLVHYEKSSDVHQKESVFLSVVKIRAGMEKVFKDNEQCFKEYERALAAKLSLEEEEVLTSELKEVRIRANEAEVQLAQMKEKGDEYLVALRDMKAKRALLQNEIQQHKDENACLSKTAALKEVDMVQLRGQLASRDSMIAQLNEDVANLSSDLKQKKLEVVQLEEGTRQLAEMKEKGDEYLVALRDMKTKRALLQNEIQQHKDENACLSTTAALKEVDMDQLRGQLASRDSMIVQLNEDVANLSSDLKQKKLEVVRLERAINELKCTLEEKEQETVPRMKCMALDKSTSTDSEEGDGGTESNNELRFRRIQDEVEGYKAIIKSLQRQLDEAETREMEHLHTQQQFRKLKQSLQVNLENRFHEKELVSRRLSEDEQTLRDHNLQLEEQVSVLSQWMDKQRHQVEQLESSLHYATVECNTLMADLKLKENITLQNMNLRRDLEKAEVELDALRRMAGSDVQEELMIRFETQAHLVAALNERNRVLHKQVEDLQSKMKLFNGTIHQDGPRSPSMPPPSGSDLRKENTECRERIQMFEEEFNRLQYVSTVVRRCVASLVVLTSVPMGNVKGDLLVSMSHEMLLPCSLLSDHLNFNASLEDTVALPWKVTICAEWFACMSQKAVTAACIQHYVTTISRLSQKLLDIVMNLQDDQGNTALHHMAANMNLPALHHFINQQCCDTCIRNKAGYNPLMILSSMKENISDDVDTFALLVERTGVNVACKDQRTVLMLAAGTGNVAMVSFFIEKGCDMNAKDKDGSTALMYAVQNGHSDVVQMLLSQSHCDVQAKDNDGHTAQDIAKAIGNQHILSLLKQSTTFIK